MRILGLDYGSKTVGVAVSDELGITAQAVETIKRESEGKLRRTLARIEALISEYGAGSIVLGLPRNMDNSLGERAEKTMAFQERLAARTGLPVFLWDERLSTAEADRMLREAGRQEKRDRKEVIDQVAAQLILQGYLDRMNGERRNG